MTGKNWEKTNEIAVVLHLFYSELLDEISSYLKHLGHEFDLYVTIPEGHDDLADKVRERYPDARILVNANLGRDILPFLNVLQSILPLNYTLLLKLHSKETLHRPDGMSWRHDVLEKLLGSTELVDKIKSAFLKDSNLGMLGPLEHVLDSRFYMGRNKDRVQDFLLQTGFPRLLPESFFFVASTMFWCRPEIFQPLLTANITADDFEPEPLPEDGTTAHALERLFGLLTTIQGFTLKEVDNEGHVFNPDPYRIYSYAPAPAYLRLREMRSVVFYRANDQPYTAIEYLRITAPFRQAGVEVIQGDVEGEPDIEKVLLGDAVIFQQKFPQNSFFYDQLVSAVRKAGKFIIYEIDDLSFDLPEEHPERKNDLNTQALLPMFSALVEADLVIVPTDKLRQALEGYNTNIVVLPNYLDDNIWNLEPPAAKEQDIVTIGYMGGNSQMPDLDLISPALIALAKKYQGKLKFKIWDTPLPESLQDMSYIEWQASPTNTYTEFVEFFQTQSADIFIAPLADNLFNNCKSPLKFLEYSARGVPGVYSAVEPYRLIIEDGKDGLLATNQEEWIQALERLIENAPLRARIAKAAQKKIRRRWLLTHNVPSWSSILETLPVYKYQETALKPLSIHLINTIRRQVLQMQLNLRQQESNLDVQNKALNEHMKVLESQVVDGLNKYATLDVANQALSNQVSLLLQTNAEANDRIRKMLDEIDSLDEQAHYWSGLAHQRSSEMDQKKQQLDDAHAAINKIYASRSWKLLAPARKVNGGLGKVKQGLHKAIRPVSKFTKKMTLKRDLDAVITSGLFDEDYYLKYNPDIKNAKVDPLKHFVRHGGAEGRAPSAQFDTVWYLMQYPDVKNAGINPLIHYIRFGRAEGRSAIPIEEKGQQKTAGIENKPVQSLIQKSLIPDRLILEPELLDLLQTHLKPMFQLSISHDDYLTVTGGAQVYMADEQRKLNEAGESYLHIYPYTKGKYFQKDDLLVYIGINLDGKLIGFSEICELSRAITNLKTHTLDQVNIHQSMGFTIYSLQRLLDLAEKRGVFWLHDYFSLCPSYNLLRNDSEYCGAPVIDSNACAVCNYLPPRKEQLSLFVKLFSDNNLEVAAPSQFTYELWQDRFPVKGVKSHIIPPARLEWQQSTLTGYTGGVLRVGFLGYPLGYKGWETWKALTLTLSNDKRYKFFHFSAQNGGPGNYKFVETRVTKENRMAMVEALKWNQIDVVILWSQVAETFSFTLHEALAAGAFILTNAHSGNIQDYVNRNPSRGWILDESNLISFFQSGKIIQEVSNYHSVGRPHANLIIGGFQEIEL